MISFFMCSAHGGSLGFPLTPHRLLGRARVSLLRVIRRYAIPIFSHHRRDGFAEKKNPGPYHSYKSLLLFLDTFEHFNRIQGRFPTFSNRAHNMGKRSWILMNCTRIRCKGKKLTWNYNFRRQWQKYFSVFLILIMRWPEFEVEHFKRC